MFLCFYVLKLLHVSHNLMEKKEKRFILIYKKNITQYYIASHMQSKMNKFYSSFFLFCYVFKETTK